MKRISRIAVASLTLALIFASVQAVAGPPGPASVVTQYCQKDFEGARLSFDAKQKSGIMSFVFGTEEVTTAWDTVIVVKKFRVLPPPVTPQTRKIRITVEYSVLAENGAGVELSINPHIETYTFDLKRIHGQWMIEDPAGGLPPHVSLETDIRDMQSLVDSKESSQSVYDDDIKKRNKEVLEKLKKLQDESM